MRLFFGGYLLFKLYCQRLEVFVERARAVEYLILSRLYPHGVGGSIPELKALT